MFDRNLNINKTCDNRRQCKNFSKKQLINILVFIRVITSRNFSLKVTCKISITVNKDQKNDYVLKNY